MKPSLTTWEAAAGPPSSCARGGRQGWCTDGDCWMLKRHHYLPKSQGSPNYCRALGSLSIRVATTASSSCDRWLGSSHLVTMGSEPTQIFSSPLKKRRKKKKENDPQIPIHSCQLVAICKSEVSYLQRHRLSVPY